MSETFSIPILLAIGLGVIAVVAVIAVMLRRPAMPAELAEGLVAMRENQSRLAGQLDQIGRSQDTHALAISGQEKVLADRLNEHREALSRAIGDHKVELSDRLAEQQRTVAREINEQRTALADRMAAQEKAIAEAVIALNDRLSQQQQAVAKEISDQRTLLAERLGGQEKVLAEAIAALKSGMTETLTKSTSDTLTSLSGMGERLAVIDKAQETITALSEQVTGLQNLLGNKQARGAFAESQLMALISDVLSPSEYTVQHTLSNKTRVDCLLKLADPPGPVGVDSKFPLEAFRRLRSTDAQEDQKAAAKQFVTDVLKHVRDIAEKYIIPGETADSALLFVPSEAVYATLHVEFPAVIEEAFQRRVWIVSPTTMMAILNTMRAISRDARMRQEARTIQQHVAVLGTDVRRLSERVENLKRHFNQAQDDVRQIDISTDKIGKQADRIADVRLDDPVPAIVPPA